MSWLLSVDGGGTKTKFCAANLRGEPLATVTVGSVSFKSVGMEAATANLREGLAQLACCDCAQQEILRGIWGLSGCDTPGDQIVFESMLREAGLSLETNRVLNDAVIAFYSAADAPGVVVIAGTGSIALGMDSRSGTIRCGGWNYAFSDLGSGYWMGAALLRETALWLDGCREHDPVFDAVCTKVGMAPGESMLMALSELCDGDEIASFARLVLEGESPLCTSIREQAADYLYDYGSRVLARLHSAGERDCSVVLSGGLMENDGFYTLVAGRFSGQNVIRNIVPPVMGGLRLARAWAEKEN